MNSPIFLPLVLVLAGPFVGSLLGVLIMRLPEGRPVVIGRSACDACHQPLGPLDMIPLASYAIQRGKCRYCGVRIAPIHPLIELAALGVSLWAAMATTGAMLIAACVFGWMLLAIALTDVRSGVLPYALTTPLAAFGLFASVRIAPYALLDHAIGAACGFALGAMIVLTLSALSNAKQTLAGAALLGAIGAWVSWQGLPYVIGASIILIVATAVVRFWTAAIPPLRQVLGAALAISAWLVWLYRGPF